MKGGRMGVGPSPRFSIFNESRLPKLFAVLFVATLGRKFDGPRLLLLPHVPHHPRFPLVFLHFFRGGS